MGRSASTTSLESITRIRARNQEFGNLLATARRDQRKSLSECAAHIATTRQRYTAIEHGTAPIHAAELELLLDYLNIPAEHVWPALATGKGQPVIVTLEPGEMIMLMKHAVISHEHREE